ncbi:MAG: DUF2997 domain-containing protein [Planctomycetaceae bacterium]|nr:DUF2997 domain-containing protein [Planctomycetaceae bacterium]
MKTIEVIVSPQGEARLETRGFDGPTCQAADEFLRRSLGRVNREQLLSAYHRVATNEPAVTDQRRVGTE